MPVEIGRDRVRQLVGEGAQLVEALPDDAYEQLHLPGALSIPLTRMDRDATAILDPARAIVVYCFDTQ
jgi:rhodanese-related sulfurtransferase